VPIGRGGGRRATGSSTGAIAGADDDRCARDGEEGESVDDHRDSNPPGCREHAAGQWPRREPDVPRRLDTAVRHRESGLARDPGHERELGRLRHREADPEHGGEAEDRRAAAHEREADRHRGLCERDDEQHASRVVAVCDQARGACEEDRRRPDGDEEERDGEPGPGRLLQLQRERDEGEPVAERGEPHRAHEDVQVAAHESSSQTTRPSRVTTRPMPLPG
jgi:hypothetical protein